MRRGDSSAQTCSIAVPEQALAGCGRIDAPCHPAGAFRMGEAVHETSDDTWDAMLGANARAFVNVARRRPGHARRGRRPHRRRRCGRGADLARVVVFLASGESRAVHGAALPATGCGAAAG